MVSTMNANRRVRIGPFRSVPDVSTMAKIELAISIQLDKHLFQEASCELAWAGCAAVSFTIKLTDAVGDACMHAGTLHFVNVLGLSRGRCPLRVNPHK